MTTNMIGDFINRRRLGRLKGGYKKQSEIINYITETRNMVQVQKYKVKQHPPSSGPIEMAINSNGKQILTGSDYYKGQTIHMINVESGHIHSSTSDATKLIRLQWEPFGNKCYSVTADNGLRLIDTSQQKTLYHWQPCLPDTNLHWSDWNPKESNIIATMTEHYLGFIDTREDPLSGSKILNSYPRVGDPIKPLTTCLWSRRNQDQLIVSNIAGSVSMIDRRKYCTKIEMGTIECKSRGYFNLSPYDRYLFASERGRHRGKNIYQYEFNESSRTYELVRRYLADYYNYYATDNHIYISQTDEISTRHNPHLLNNYIGVYNCATGRLVYSRPIKSQTNDSTICKVYGIPDDVNRQQELYTLNRSYAQPSYHIDVWSLSEGFQSDTRIISRTFEAQ